MFIHFIPNFYCNRFAYVLQDNRINGFIKCQIYTLISTDEVDSGKGRNLFIYISVFLQIFGIQQLLYNF